MLCIVPLGSWYYLKKGLDYRKDSMEKLKGTTSIYELCPSVDVVKGETTLIAKVRSNKNYLKELSLLMSEFDDVPNLMCLVIDGPDSTTKSQDLKIPEQFKFQKREDACNYKFAELTLVDTAGIIRRSYPSNEQGYIEIIEHLAFILPSPEERDIKAKTYDSK